MPESTPTEESWRNNVGRNRAVAGLVAFGALLAGGAEVAHLVEGDDSKESKLSAECLKPGEKVDVYSGTVVIPKGINRDSAPRVGHNADESTQLYSDREEFVTSPIQIQTPNSPTAESWLCYLNADGKISFVAETKDSIWAIQVDNDGKTVPLAEERNLPGAVVETTVRSISKEGITASQSEVEEPIGIAMIEDRD